MYQVGRNPAKGEIKMHTKKRMKSKRKGSAIAIVVCSLVILLYLGRGVLSLGLHGRLGAMRSSSDITARAAADAGLTKALFQMNSLLKAEDWAALAPGHFYDDDSRTLLEPVEDERLPNCDATFSYAIGVDMASNYSVKCIGQSGRATRNVNATFQLRGLWDDAILVKETIKLFSGTLVDGYDSSDPSVKDVPIKIGTESWNPDDITLQPGATVDGAILYGVNADLPEITAPALVDTGTRIRTKGTTSTIGPADSGVYSSLSVLMAAVPGVLEVDGGEVVLHVTGDIQLGQSCEIVIREGSSLVIYLEGDLVAGNDSSITNDSKLAKNLMLYGIGEEQNIELKSKSAWYGAVHAPEADITVKAAADVYGSFVCSTFENMNGNFVYYDAALRDTSVDDVGASFVVARWHEE
jgi:hypothetical protein